MAVVGMLLLKEPDFGAFVVIISIAIASVNGYALANWRFKGADTFFTILIVGAFIPYQVMIYPIVIVIVTIAVAASVGGSTASGAMRSRGTVLGAWSRR